MGAPHGRLLGMPPERADPAHARACGLGLNEVAGFARRYGSGMVSVPSEVTSTIRSPSMRTW
jgi:hypothetical protein